MWGGKKKGGVIPEAGLMYQLGLYAGTFWLRVICLQVSQSADSLNTDLPTTACSPTPWLVLSYV